MVGIYLYLYYYINCIIHACDVCVCVCVYICACEADIENRNPVGVLGVRHHFTTVWAPRVMTDDGARGLQISYWTGLISPEGPLCYNNRNYQHIRQCSVCIPLYLTYTTGKRALGSLQNSISACPLRTGSRVCFRDIRFFFYFLAGFYYCCSLAGDWKCALRAGTRRGGWPDYKINVKSNNENVKNTWKVRVIKSLPS